MTGPCDWETYFQQAFPGYLLAASEASAFSEEAVARFLESLTGRPRELALLKAVSFLSPRLDALESFAIREVPAFCRALPSRSEVERREWEGGFQGRLDLQGTLAHEVAGNLTRFVTRSRRRSFDLPENVLVRAVVERLLDLLRELRASGVSFTTGWSRTLGPVEGALRHALVATQLRSVARERVSATQEQAARASRDYGHRRALSWWQALRDELDVSDPARLRQLIASGALRPLEPSTRFELAVGLRLLETLHSELERSQPGRWRIERMLIRASRTELASIVCADGRRVRLIFNQAVFASGEVEQAFQHYLGHQGRMRPDLTVILEGPGGEHLSGVVLEVKLSESGSYLFQGYREAMVYRWEYSPWLRTWPKSILITSSNLAGAARSQDDVIAIDWRRWVPSEVARGILAPVCA